MKPVNEKEIEDLKLDYIRFCSLGNTELKALWLSVSGRGFIDVIGSSRDSIKLIRESDKKFVVVSYPLKDTIEIEVKKKIRKVQFHTDSSMIKENNSKWEWKNP